MAIGDKVAIRIEDVLAFNERLLAISKAGIPLYVDSDPNDIQGWIQWMNSQFAVRSGHGETIEAILHSEPRLSPEYRDALTAWVALGGSMQAAEPLVSAGRWRQNAATNMGLTLCNLWIVWLLASICLVLMVWNLTPKLIAFYNVSHLGFRPGMRFLERIYSNLPWLVAASVLIGILIPLIAWWQSRHAQFRWLPFRSKVLGALRRSEVAQTASELASRNEGDSVDVAWGNSPLTHWASDANQAPKDRAESLTIVSNLYRAVSERAIRFGQGWIPGSIGLILAAMIVLCLGLALFWPMVELIIALCEPTRIYRD